MVKRPKMKKVASFLILILMFQLVFSISPTLAEGDGSPPIVKNINVSSKEVSVGEAITVKAQAEDDNSGVKYLNASFDPPSGNRGISIRLYLNEVSGLFEGSYTVGAMDEGGLWKFNYVAAYDNASNYEMYYSNVFEENLDFSVINADGDGIAPTVQSIQVTPSEVSPGEKITVKAQAEDDNSGVKYLNASFDPPSGNRGISIRLYLNEVSGLFEGSYTVGAMDEGGLWKFNYVAAYDNASNYEMYYSNVFEENLDFSVINADGDGIAPTVQSIQVTPSEVSPGEKITVKAQAEDDNSGVKYLNASFDPPSGNRGISIRLYLNEVSGLFEGSYTVGAMDEGGLWKFNYVAAYDNASNYKMYYSDSLSEPINELNFVVSHQISDLDSPSLNDLKLSYLITTKKETWIGKVIDKDLYIGPNSTITIADDVTITGNVYVFGTLISHGGLTIQGSLNAKSVTYGSNTSVSPGAVRIVGGQNSIRSTIVSNQPYEVPFTIDNEELTNENNTLEIVGKTLPFLDVSLQGNPVSLEADGSFATLAEDVTPEGIQFNLRDVFGNDMKKEFAVIDVLPPANVSGFTVLKETHNEIGVVWKTGAESDLKEYALYSNDKLITTLPADAASYKFEKLNEGTTYELAIAAVDTSNNTSEMVKVTATTLLSKPTVNPVSDKSTSVTGKASPGTKVSVQKGESVIGSGNTDAAGEFNIEIPAQKAGIELTVSVSNETGIVSEKESITVEDKTAPALLIVNPVSDKDLTVSGTAEAKSVVTVKAGETVIAEGNTDEFGKFSIAIEKQKAGLKLSIAAADAAGNTSEAKEITVSDVTAPEKPVVEKVTDKTTSITGTVEAGSVVSVKAGATEIGKATANQEGNYAVTIQKQQAGTVLKLTATDKAGNVSQATQVTVLDATAPAVPTVEEVTDKSTVIKGTAEAGSIVVVKAAGTEIGKATANSDGDFAVTIAKQKAGTKLSITATDAAGNVSAAKAVTVLDATAPTAPTVGKVTDKSVAVIGSGEVDALISIKAGSTELGTATVSSDGKYNVRIAVQKVGTKIQVTATDAAGNTSTASEVTVTDGTAPSVPNVNEVTDKSSAVTGTAEAASLVSVKAADKELGTGKVAEDGKYNITIAAQQAGTKIQVTATDAAGNTSPAKEVIVLDATAPSTPTVSKVTDQSTAVTGTAEAAAQIFVKVGSKEIGKATTSGDGKYSVAISKQKAGTVLTITATDQAGNVSAVKETVVVDGTAPALSFDNKVTHHSTRVIGTAEAASKVSVKNGSTTIGTATTDSKGNYEVNIKKQKVGAKLSITASDAAGNSSQAIPVTVVDGNYPDLKVVHWALEEIMYLGDDQIIGGYPNGGFQPDKDTTRAEAAKMLALALDLPIVDVSSGYKDVPNKHWGKNYIAAVSKAGLFTGNPDGTFAPNDVLKRSEMAKVISIAYELKSSKANHFSDVRSGHWAKGFISDLYENGITTGYPDETFHPGEPTTRAEYSVFLARAMNPEFR